eukprot:303634-Rhodomonas_salina.2
MQGSAERKTWRAKSKGVTERKKAICTTTARPHSTHSTHSQPRHRQRRAWRAQRRAGAQTGVDAGGQGVGVDGQVAGRPRRVEEHLGGCRHHAPAHLRPFPDAPPARQAPAGRAGGYEELLDARGLVEREEGQRAGAERLGVEREVHARLLAPHSPRSPRQHPPHSRVAGQYGSST